MGAGFAGFAVAVMACLAGPAAAAGDAAIPTRWDLLSAGAELLRAEQLLPLFTDTMVTVTDLEDGRTTQEFYGADGVRVFAVDGRMAGNRFEVRERGLCFEVVGGRTQCAMVFRSRDPATDAVTLHICHPFADDRCRWLVTRIVASGKGAD